MYGILVLIHVAFMISSLALMSGAVGLGLLGKTAAMNTAKVGMVATALGTVAGIGLLLDNPLSLQCALLTAYLVGVSLLYYYGFGLGRVENARLVRLD